MKLPEGAATGIGSLPGTDIREAVRTVLGELPDVPHLPELPARGPGADLLGRSAGLLVDLPVDLYVGRWRLVSHAGRDARRTADLWERDLDALTEEASGYAGPLKVQCAGPWTLAAGIDLPVGGRILRDAGAVRELAASLGEGLARHVADVTRRVPGARVLLQLDEPSLPAVLAGQVPTESGFSVLAPVEAGIAEQTLRQVIEACGVPVVAHCCAPDAPVGLLRSAGAAGVALDLDLVKDLDPLGEAIDAGTWLLAGAVPTSAVALPVSPPPVSPPPVSPPPASRPAVSPPPASRAAVSPPPASRLAAEKVLDLWRRLGFPDARLAGQVAVTPACGLYGASPEYARDALTACREAGRRLLDAARA